MNAAAALKLIDLAVTGLVTLLNAISASQTVSDIIAKRISEKRDKWTKAEKDQVEAELDDSERQAQEAIDKKA